jgi:hypothetical protein
MENTNKAICLFCKEDNKVTCSHLKGMTVQEVNAVLWIGSDDAWLYEKDFLSDNSCEEPNNKETFARWLCVFERCSACTIDVEDLEDQFDSFVNGYRP